MAASDSKARVTFVDAARLLGIFCVYYGHIVERVMQLGSADAALQYKFIYSFHMPFFFVIAGMVAKDWSGQVGVGTFLWSRVTSRLVPFLFFNLLLCGLSLPHKPDFPPFPLDTPGDYLNAWIATVTWLPFFNVPTWFLMGLVSVEIIHFAIFRFLGGSVWRIGLAAVGFYTVGYLLNARHAFFPNWNIWLWNEAITMYAFYLAGIALMRLDIAQRLARWPVALAIALLGIAVVYRTYDYNDGPFRLGYEAVVILAAAHGQWLLFPLTALVGSLALLAAGRLVDSWNWVGYLGRNVMVIFCLNGVFYHHINGPFATWLSANGEPNAVTLTVAATILSILCIAATVPFIYLFDRWIPQLIGRPNVAGPLLPKLG